MNNKQMHKVLRESIRRLKSDEELKTMKLRRDELEKSIKERIQKIKAEVRLEILGD